MIRSQCLVVLTLSVLAYPCLGEISLDDALEGFDSEEPTTIEPDLSELDDILNEFDASNEPSITTPETPAIIDTDLPTVRLSGSIRQKFIVNFSHDPPTAGEFDHRGLSSMSTRLDLELESKLANDFRMLLTGHLVLDPIHPKQASPAQTTIITNSSDHELKLGEAFVQGPLSDSMDLTFGRQIVVWGRSDQFRVTDILNPVDNRRPGLTDIKDLRLPVTMARFDFYTGPWSSSFILVPERRFDRTPEPGSDYYFGPVPLPQREYPGGQFGKPDIAFALTGTFSGWDLSLYSARLLSRSPYIELGPEGPKRKHQRITMIGSAANFVVGSWLLKAEIAVHRNLRFTNVPDRDFQRITALAGVEYSGIVDTTLALEATTSHISDFDNRLLEPPESRRANESAMAFRIGRTFLNDALDLTIAAMVPTPIGTNGGLARTQVTYDLNDSVELYGGALLYFRGDNLPYSKIADNDRLFFGLNYHF